MPEQAGRHIVKREKGAQTLKGFEKEESAEGSDRGFRRALNKGEVGWRGGIEFL
jgi:hypothetical protein